MCRPVLENSGLTMSLKKSQSVHLDLILKQTEPELTHSDVNSIFFLSAGKEFGLFGRKIWEFAQQDSTAGTDINAEQKKEQKSQGRKGKQSSTAPIIYY